MPSLVNAFGVLIVLIPYLHNDQTSTTQKMSRTHTISNSSTFRGWLESMGIDDMFSDPCGCIFGESQADPIPVPG